MSKELEALEDLINFIGSGEIANTVELCEYVLKRKEIIEKALKALEIIKRYTTKDGVHIDFNKIMVAAMQNCDNFTWIADEEIISEIHLLTEVLL